MQSIRRNRIHKVNLVVRDLHLQLANPDLERRYRVATAFVCFRCLYHFPTEVIQFLVVLRDDALGVIKRALQLRRMLPCLTKFLRALPILLTERFDLSGSHARRGQKRVMRRGAPASVAAHFRINRARVGDTRTVQSTSEIANFDSCRFVGRDQ